MESICLSSGLDGISDLPSNVIDHILTYLSLKDAVRTSTLSKKWREKWHTLPRIIVDVSSFHRRSRRKIEGIISYILARHEGKIEKFTVAIEKVKDCYSLKLWIWRLSKKSIQELSILIARGRRKEVPSSLFSCQHLRRLHLCRFKINWANTFRGFCYLISLQLNKVNIPTAVFEGLICSCPLLQRLSVKNLSCIEHLRINVPRLKYFYFDGEFKSMWFHTPFLEVLSINLYRIDHQDNPFDLRFRFRVPPPAIRVLDLRCHFRKFLAATDAFTQVSNCYSHLRILGIKTFCFENVDEIAGLLALVGSALNLQILNIGACGCIREVVSEPILQFWEEKNRYPLSLNQLQKVTMRSFHGEDFEMRFIQFVLEYSPILSQFTVQYMKNPDFNLEEVKAVLVPFCPVSTDFSFLEGTYDYSRDDSSDSDDTSDTSSNSD